LAVLPFTSNSSEITARPSWPAPQRLEQQIGEVLRLAKATDRSGLARVIAHLRAARNLVVMEVGWE
jgi:hypothetical protein